MEKGERAWRKGDAGIEGSGIQGKKEIEWFCGCKKKHRERKEQQEGRDGQGREYKEKRRWRDRGFWNSGQERNSVVLWV